jgi:hypothetical protein
VPTFRVDLPPCLILSGNTFIDTCSICCTNLLGASWRSKLTTKLKMHGLPSRFSTLSHWFSCLLLCHCHAGWLLWLCRIFWNQVLWCDCFWLVLFWLSNVFCEFWIISSNNMKNAWYFDRYCIESVDFFGWCGHFISVKSPNIRTHTI